MKHRYLPRLLRALWLGVCLLAALPMSAQAPTITQQPLSQTVTEGQSASFSVVASGGRFALSYQLSYQWYQSGIAISGATASSYTTPATTVSDNGAAFYVMVSSFGGSVTSTTATLTVNALNPPVITLQPQSLTVNTGQTATFRVTASGTAPLAYQWYTFGGLGPISGATSNTLTFLITTATDAGSYYVEVSNGAGLVTSSAATLTVNAPPTPPSITAQPTNVTVTAGATATFSVMASGTAPLSYQWSKNGLAISGATSASYVTPATVIGDSGATFGVVVTNSAGTVTSTNATLTVNPVVAPTITAQPANVTVTVGATASFSVTASGTAPFTYQWRKNGTAITGATSGGYTTPATVIGDSGATFSVVVTNSGGSVTSTNATLTVNPVGAPITVSVSPSTAYLNTGDSLAFTATVSGSSNTAVTWSIQEGATGGSVNSAGAYMAPARPGLFHIVATSQADSSKSAVVPVRVSPKTCLPNS